MKFLDNYNRIVWAIVGTILLVALVIGSLCCLKWGQCSSKQVRIEIQAK